MIHQGTLSLILTLDDFLISGPHLVTDAKQVSTSDPNIFFLKRPEQYSTEIEETHSKDLLNVTTYFVLRPYIRGILYGLNPLYQISLYVPCKDRIKMDFYREIISKIDIGGQFFQDRIYWDFEALNNDIMDPRLACLIYAGEFDLDNAWLKNISIESKPFIAKSDVDFTKNDNLFDLVEMRSFLEDVHQRYLSLVKESKKIYFAEMIRLHVEEKGRRSSGQSDITNTSGFYSATNAEKIKRSPQPFSSDRHSSHTKSKKDFFIFKPSEKSSISWRVMNTNALLEEYEDIIQEQLEINHDINHAKAFQTSFAKALCRWNKITQRKSDILKLLMNQGDKAHIHERLRDLNSIYCMKKCRSENDLLASVHSTKSDMSTGSGNSSYLVISNQHEPTNNNEPFVQFTTWYSKEIKLK